MLASDVITLGAAVFGLLTAIAGSTACAYNSSRSGRINIAVLKVKVHALENLIQALRRQVNGTVVVNPDPSPWIHKAQEFLIQVDVSQLEETVHDKCVSGWLPNLCLQMRAGRMIEETIARLDVLIEEGQYTCRESTVKGSKQPAVIIMGESRTQATEAIWNQVSRATTATIFIHGSAGVGKTAVAISIHNRALAEPHLFDYVIWVPVKYGVGLWQVQEDLARTLEVDVSSISDTSERARRLSSTLSERGKFLLVLDSMWQAFSLQDIGIPEHTCKLIVTSRIRSVCRRITRKELFEIKPLHLDEAWELFMSELGSRCSRLHAETLASTESAIAELDGLPLAIKIFAQVLSEIHEESSPRFNAAWREELAALGRMPTYLGHRDQDLFECFRHSYENLRVETRPCFLFCALFPKDHPIEVKVLIEYWMWDGLLGKIETLEKSIKQGKDMVKELKDAHLLENVTEEGGEDAVKIVNLVRLMAVDTMVHAGHQVFIRSGDFLTDLPSGQEWPDEVERASFMQNQLKGLIMRSKPNCKRLSTLLLQDNPLNLDSHDNFFYGMRDLRVVDLSRTNISTLPKSLSYLTNLRALLLRTCPNLKKIPPLSNLQQLIVLDLFGTPLEHFPDGVQNMTKIRRLDLSLTRLESFPAKLLVKLVQLEELLLITDDSGGYVWGSNQTDPHWKGACIEELVGLGKLTALQLNFLNAKVFNKYIRASTEAVQNTSTPPRFRLCVGGFHRGGHAGDNSVTVIGDYRVMLPDSTSELHLMMSNEVITVLTMKGCLRDLNVLDVSNFSGLRYLFSVKILGSLKNLRKIRVRRCEKMEEVIQPAAEGNPATIFLPELTTMVFFDLPRLKSICHGQVLNCPHLCSVEVWSCEDLKLPMILGRNRGKIEIRGEKIWIDELKWDNPQGSNPLFQESPQSNSNFRFVKASVPPDLEATARIWKKPHESSSSVRDVVHRSGTFRNSSSTSNFLKMPRLNFRALAAASLIRPTSNGDNDSTTAAATDGGALQTVLNTLRIVNAIRAPNSDGDIQPPP